METAYREEELEKLLPSHLKTLGYNVEADKALAPNVGWRPPFFAKRTGNELAIDLRMNDSITDFWLNTYETTYQIFPHLKIFVAIPEDVIVPFILGRKLEAANVGIIQISFEGINFLLEPRSSTEREAARTIRKKLDARIDTAVLEYLGSYNKEITDAVNIFEIGFPREAIGAIGRILETAIDQFLAEANKVNRIRLSAEKRKSMPFHNKIEWLASTNKNGKGKARIISDGEKSKMLSVKWDRNIGDHPANDEELQQLINNSRAILELGISMIGLMKRKKDEL